MEEDNKICIDDAKDFSGPLIQEEFWKRCNIQEHSIEVALVCGVCQSFFIAEVQTMVLKTGPDQSVRPVQPGTGL